MTFDTLGLMPDSLRAVADQGYHEPTPVQAQAIPAILGGRDLLAGAQTGTGKTAAFVLPMLQLLHASRGPGPRRVRGLVVVPTRELALQVEQSIRTYGAHRPIRSVAIYGGVRMDRQVRALRGGAEIVVATPGRLLDHVRQRTIDLGHVEILVLDEADRMLDMGFIHDIKSILALLPRARQSLLFSATFTPRIRALAEELLRDPESIDVAPRNTAAAPIRQLVHPVDKSQKRHLLTHMVRTRRVDQVLVFTRTKRGANRLAEQLGKDGIQAAAIHGNKSQSQRVRALTSFKNGQSQVLVATDVAARGIDIESLPHVINFELPTVPEDYVHRIGRTGRAGQEGTAISLVSADEQELMLAIERLLKLQLEQEVVDGFEPQVAFRPQPIRGTRQIHGGAHKPGRGYRGDRRVETGTRPRQHGPRRLGSGPLPVAGGGQHRPGQGPTPHALPGERISGGRPGSPDGHGSRQPSLDGGNTRAGTHRTSGRRPGSHAAGDGRSGTHAENGRPGSHPAKGGRTVSRDGTPAQPGSYSSNGGRPGTYGPKRRRSGRPTANGGRRRPQHGGGTIGQQRGQGRP